MRPEDFKTDSAYWDALNKEMELQQAQQPPPRSIPVIPIATNVLRIGLLILPLVILGNGYRNFSIIIYLLPEFFSSAVMRNILGCLGFIIFLATAGFYYWLYYKLWRSGIYVWSVFIAYVIFASWVGPLINEYRNFHVIEADIEQCLFDDDALVSLTETQRQMMGLWWQESDGSILEICPDGTYLGSDKVKRNWWILGGDFAIFGNIPVKFSVTENKMVVAGQSYRRLTDEEKAQEQEHIFLGAAARGQLDIVQQLLSQGVEINTQTNAGFTALILAARRDQAEVVKELLAHGADVNIKDKQGLTALQWAIQTEHTDIANMLQATNINTQ